MYVVCDCGSDKMTRVLKHIVVLLTKQLTHAVLYQCNNGIACMHVFRAL